MAGRAVGVRGACLTATIGSAAGTFDTRRLAAWHSPFYLTRLANIEIAIEIGTTLLGRAALHTGIVAVAAAIACQLAADALAV